MRKADIVEGEAYQVPAPGNSGGRHGTVKATIVKAGVVRDGVLGRRHTRADGCLVRLEERAEERTWQGMTVREPGFEYKVATRDIRGPWSEALEERMLEREANRSRAERVPALMAALGLDEARGPDRIKEAVGEPTGERAGYRVMGANKQVAIDIVALLPWLERIDPVRIGEEAIGHFVEAVRRDEPWKGLGDVTEEELAGWRALALSDIAEGIAVTDAELAPDG